MKNMGNELSRKKVISQKKARREMAEVGGGEVPR